MANLSITLSLVGFLFLYQLPGLIPLRLLLSSSRGLQMMMMICRDLCVTYLLRVCVAQTYISINSFAVAPDHESVLYCHPDRSHMARFPIAMPFVMRL